MSSLKLSRLILTAMFIFFTLAAGLGAFQYYRHLCKAERINFSEYCRETSSQVLQRIQGQWEQEITKLIQSSQRLLPTSLDMISRALLVIARTHPEIQHAFYIDPEAIYLPEWKKWRIPKTSTDLSFNLLENPDFKQAEILEFQFQQFDEAVKIYERFWLENPNNFQAANALARCLFKLKSLDRSEKIYLQIFKQNPDVAVEADVPLALIAGLQLLTIYQLQEDKPRLLDFGTRLYRVLLDEQWDLSKVKLDYFKRKLMTLLSAYPDDPGFSQRLQALQQQERALEKSKAYVQFLTRRIIPFIESSTITHYRVYLLQDRVSAPRFLLIIPRSPGHIVLEIDYSAFIQNRIAEYMQALAKERKLGFILKYANTQIKFSDVSRGIAYNNPLSSFFPDLWLKTMVPWESMRAVEKRLGAFKTYFLWAYGLFVLVLILIYLVLYRQIQLAELKSDFVSHVSHELKTPLTSLRMFSEMLYTHPRLAPAKRRQYYGIMQEESIRLSRLIENLLDVSRIEKKKGQYVFKPESLNAVLRIVLDIFNNFLNHSHGLKVKLQGAAKVRMDKDAMIRLFINLLDNARKFSPVGSQIEITSTVVDNQAIVTIRDHGAGIPRADLKKVFRKFYQVKKTYDDRFKGVGLGLAIVRAIAQAHRAKVLLDSVWQQGTTVTVSLPCVQAKESFSAGRRD